MKRYGNLYEKIYDKDNLLLAHKMAKKDKGLYKAVQEVDGDLDNKIEEIYNMLKNKTYIVGNYNISVINDKGKQRVLHKLPYFPDRIIQWAILLQIEQIFLNTFTNFTCASIPKRGIHYASKLLTSYMKNDFEGTQYCLKIDIKKFYPNINREILKKLLRKKFKDNDLLILLDNIIDSMNNADITNLNISNEYKELFSRPNKGIPIGSYLSQYLANFYLTYFDHYLKEELGVKYTIRYMDDVVILASSKEELHEIFDNIQIYLKNNLDLEIKSNWQIFPTAIRGINFVGYRHFYGYKLLRKSTYKRCKQKMIYFKYCVDNKIPLEHEDWCSYMSYLGWLSWCNSYSFFMKYCKDCMDTINDYYMTNIKSEKNKKKSVITLKIYNESFKKNRLCWEQFNLERKSIHKKGR